MKLVQRALQGINTAVAPSRGRGLKPSTTEGAVRVALSPLHGGVD